MANPHTDKLRLVYYESFSGYSHPLKLIGEVTKEQAIGSNSYVVGYYSSDKILLIIERYVGGKLFFRHDYYYGDGGDLIERRSVNVEGTVVVEKM